MVDRSNLPGIDTILTNDKLSAAAAAELGRSILLIGTSGQGPVNEPLVVRNVQDAVDTFGERGTLIEGFMEAYYAPGGQKDIRMMRISNGNRAELNLTEQIAGEGVQAPQETPQGDPITALNIRALHPGSIYNNVSFRDDGGNIIGYNPLTGEETFIKYDPTGLTAGSVRDVKSLANAINVDPNLGNIVEATPNAIRAMFEIDIQEDWHRDNEYGYLSFGRDTSDRPIGTSVSIDLTAALERFDINDDGLVDYPVCSGDPSVDYRNLDLDEAVSEEGAVTLNISSSAGSLASIADDWPETGFVKLYKVTGTGEEYDVEIMKYNGIGPEYSATGAAIQVAADDRGYGGTESIAHEPHEDLIVSFYIPLYPTPILTTAGNLIDEIIEVYELENLAVDLDSAGRVQIELPHPIQMGPGKSRSLLKLDGSEDTVKDGEAAHIVRNNMIATGDGEQDTFRFTAYEVIDEDAVDSEGNKIFKVYRTSQSGVQIDVTEDVELTMVGGDVDPENLKVAEIVFNTPPKSGSIITVDYNSVPFPLTQLNTYAAVTASTSYREYFVAGTQITFGTAQPGDVKIVYPAKVVYHVGDEISVSGNKDNIITITPISRSIDLTSGTVIGLDYYYQPEWISLTAASLQGGTDGIVMSNNEKYRVLDEAYDQISDYPVDIIVPLRTYIDDTKIIYDAETGLPTEVNAGFAQQLSRHLESMLEGVNEAYGKMSVKPSAGTRLVDKNEWIDKLLNVSPTDPTRAANIMQVLDARLLDIIAMEPVVTNANVVTSYTTTAEALLAGLDAKLTGASAPTNKPLGSSVVGLRHRLSDRELNDLTGARYVTARLRPGVGLVVTDGVTAAAPDSVWNRRQTYFIVSGIMTDIRIIGEPYLGEGFSPQKKAALHTAISKMLAARQEAGELKSYQFTIEQTPQEDVEGKARIPLVLQPVNELRKVRVTVKLSATSVD